MRYWAAVFVIMLFVMGCTKPNDIVLGPEPLKQIADQGKIFKKMPEEDRTLLVGYITMVSMGKALGADIKPVTGRTVGEVLVDARAWKEKMKQAETDAKARAEEAEKLKAAAQAEKEVIAEKISSSVTVAVVDKKILPKNYDVGRYSEMLSLEYAVENKSDKPIIQLKGTITFTDATGDKIGDLSVSFDEPINPKNTLRTTTGIGWKLNRFSRGDIEKIAEHDFSLMKAIFTPESIAFEGGEVIKASS